MEKVKLKEVLKQKKDVFEIKDNEKYKQVTVSNTGEVKLRAIKKGVEIGTKKQYKIKTGWFIYSRLGIHQGSFGIVPKELDGAIVTGDMPVFEINKKKILPDILIYLLGQKKIKDIFEDLTRGLAQSRIREKYLLDIEVPLPSLKEQKQILKKINSIKNEINQLEKNVSHDENLLTKFRQAILQEAVQGKLVPQNPKDEHASELLKKIKKEKEKLIKEGKIKKPKDLPAIEEDEVPYDLPSGWVWCRLGDVFITSTGGTPSRRNSNYWKGNIPWLKSGELNDSFNINSSEEFITEEGLKNSSAKMFNKGSLVLALYGATAGKLGILGFDTTTNQAVCNFRENFNISIKYLFYYLKSIREKIISECFGGAQPNISQGYVKKILFPLPPLFEQKRIVEKVDVLMGLCDELELRVKENKEGSESLMGTVLRESFEK